MRKISWIFILVLVLTGCVRNRYRIDVIRPDGVLHSTSYYTHDCSPMITTTWGGNMTCGNVKAPVGWLIEVTNEGRIR